jgi:hypothetical protein
MYWRNQGIGVDRRLSPWLPAARPARKHVKEDWALLYIERWLTAPMELEDGTRVERTKGTPQGGVVSPVMANLFTFNLGNMRSGVPGRSRRCNLNRKPIACAARRTTISGLVLVARTALMLALRLSGPPVVVSRRTRRGAWPGREDGRARGRLPFTSHSSMPGEARIFS